MMNESLGREKKDVSGWTVLAVSLQLLLVDDMARIAQREHHYTDCIPFSSRFCCIDLHWQLESRLSSLTAEREELETRLEEEQDEMESFIKKQSRTLEKVSRLCFILFAGCLSCI